MTSATCVGAEALRRDIAADPCVATAAIVGGSGYTGGLLAELLLRHPVGPLAAMTSETLAGTPVQHTCRGCAPISTSVARRLATSTSPSSARRTAGGAGRQAPARRRRPGGRLSRRLPPAAEEYARVVRGTPCPELLPAVYGLTELHREEIAAARLVANPGCYPTAALLALAPLEPTGCSTWSSTPNRG